MVQNAQLPMLGRSVKQTVPVARCWLIRKGDRPESYARRFRIPSAILKERGLLMKTVYGNGTVLVVEDHEGTACLLRFTLVRRRLYYTHARDGLMAQDLIAARPLQACYCATSLSIVDRSGIAATGQDDAGMAVDPRAASNRGFTLRDDDGSRQSRDHGICAETFYPGMRDEVHSSVYRGETSFKDGSVDARGRNKRLHHQAQLRQRIDVGTGTRARRRPMQLSMTPHAINAGNEA